MSNESNQLTTRQPESVKDYLALPAYKSRFEEVLRNRAPQFMAAITAVSQLPSLKDAEPKSVIAAAMVAATLDLPVNPTLGQAHIVAYGDGAGRKVAQFQIGYKGLIQLALRSGQYKRLNAGPVSGAVFKGYDMMGEPVLDWSKTDPLAPVTGYFCAFETLNGFQKIVYWTKEQAEAHAKRFSKAYAKGYSTPWKSDFDAMATKTVVKAALTKWGILSVEMQRAAVHDQGVQADVEADVKYVDGEDRPAEGDPEKPVRPPPPPRAKKGAAAIDAEIVSAPVAAPEETKPFGGTGAETIVAPAVAPTAPAPAPESNPDLEAAAPEPAKPAPKTALAIGETAEGEFEVLSVATSIEKFKGETGPVDYGVVTAEVKGPAYFGMVRCIKGATIQGDKAVAMPQWAVGNELKLKLVGKDSKKHGVHASVAAWEPVNPEAV